MAETLGRPTLSLCLIVRNEVSNLKRCLDSAQGLVDEIIVVDTGSDDGTPELAQQLGATVYHDQWQGDFSRARNVSLSRATGDWVLILDADEELAGGKELIPGLLEADSQVEGYLLQVESPTTDLPGAQVLRHLNLRLFRRRPEYAFAGAIHEQILPSILSARPQARILEAEVVIRHHGYLQAQNAAKATRNRAILEAALAATPEDPFLRYHLGITRYQERDVKGALELFWPLYHRLSPETSFYPTLVRHLAIALLDAGNPGEALGLLEKECQRFQDYPELFYLRALALRRLGRHQEAIQVLEHCCQMADPPRHYVSTVGTNGTLGLVMLGEIHRELGEGDKAAQCFLKAWELMPEHQGAWSSLINELEGKGDYLGLGHLYYRRGWLAQAADCYLKALEAKVCDEAMCLAMGKICTAKGLHREAAIFYQQAAEFNPNPTNSLLLAQARLKEARAWLAEGGRQFPNSAQLAGLKEAIDVSWEYLSRGEG